MTTVDNDLAPSRPAQRRRRNPVALWLLIPGILGLGVSFVAPLIWVVRMSFNRGGGAGEIINALSLDTYAKVLTDNFTWQITLNTLKLGVIVTALTLVLAYPIGLFLTKTTSRFRGLLIALAVAPLLTSQVVRTYGWLVLLGPGGVVNGSLQTLGFIGSPIRLSNGYLGVVIALIEILMPYAILVMVSGFGATSIDLEQAAASLGANRFKTFWRITLPLSLPGVFTAGLLVFVLTISSFVTPQLVGGGRVFVLATEIYSQAKQTLNWPQASALSIILLVLFSIVIAIYLRAIRRFEL